MIEEVDLSMDLPQDLLRRVKKSWTLSEVAIRWMLGLISLKQPVHIMEFGSGVSTMFLDRMTDIPVTSFDHDPLYVAKTNRVVQRDDVIVNFAPLVLRSLPIYMDAEHLPRASDQKPDFILLDGPPGRLGGRKGSFRQALELAAPDAWILLDDAGRTDERQIIRELAMTHQVELLPGSLAIGIR